MLARGGSPDLLGVVRIEPLRPLAALALSQAPPPPQLANVGELPNLLDYIALKLNITEPAGATLWVRANNEADARKKIDQIIDGLMDMARQAGEAQIEQGWKPVPIRSIRRRRSISSGSRRRRKPGGPRAKARCFRFPITAKTMPWFKPL